MRQPQPACAILSRKRSENQPAGLAMIQQFRTVITPGTSQRFVLTNRDRIFAATVDWAIASMGRHVLKTQVRTPQANAFCERLIGTMRRECLDWLIPIHEGHLRWILRDWVIHYNRGRPHASLGLGIPDPLSERNQLVSTGHRLPEHARVIATPILGGLHHEYRLVRDAA